MNYNEFFDLLCHPDFPKDYVKTWKWDKRVVIAGHTLDDVYFEGDVSAIWYDEHEEPNPFYYSELKEEVQPNIGWIRFVFEA